MGRGGSMKPLKKITKAIKKIKSYIGKIVTILKNGVLVEKKIPNIKRQYNKRKI